LPSILVGTAAVNPDLARSVLDARGNNFGPLLHPSKVSQCIGLVNAQAAGPVKGNGRVNCTSDYAFEQQSFACPIRYR
jgi:hypothetical protein